MLAVIAHDGEAPIDVLESDPGQLDIPAGYADETADALNHAVVALKSAILRNNARCQDGSPFDGINNVLLWERHAQLLGVDTVANGLDHDTIHQSLCARLVIDEFEIPPSLGSEQDSLEISVGMQISGLDVVTLPQFVVTVTGIGCQIHNPEGLTDENGAYTIVYSRNGGPVSSLTATACFAYPGTNAPANLCASRISTPPAYYLAGSYVGTGPLATDPGFATVSVTQNQGVLEGRFRSVGDVEVVDGEFTALVGSSSITDVTVELHNCTLENAQPSLSVIENGNQTTISLSIDGIDCHAHALGSIVACGPRSDINELDLSGVWTGAIKLGSDSYDIVSSVSGNFQHICGNISGDRTGAFCADIFRSANAGSCPGTVYDFELTFSDCPLTSGEPFEYGCVDYENGIMTISLITNAHWTDSCTGNELVEFRLWRELDICTGD